MMQYKLILSSWRDSRGGLIGNPGNPWLDGYLLAVLASSILGYLSWRGWINITLFLLLIPALVELRRGIKDSRHTAVMSALRPVIITLALPFTVLLITQVLRHELILEAYDGPLRMLLSAVLLWYFCVKRVVFTRILVVAAPLALFILVAEVKLNPHALVLWGGRFATYFVDTDTFGVYALVLASFCLFSMRIAADGANRGVMVLQILGLVAGLYLVIGSNTRGSWLALPFVLGLWFLLRRPRMDWRMSIVLVVLMFCLGLAFILYPGAVARLGSAFNEVSMWFSGSSRDTSAGLRLTMWHMSWELFKHSPLNGYGDTGFRAFLNEPWITSFASPAARQQIFLGPHNEFLANLLRSGVLGGISVLGLFFAPFVVFWRQRHHADVQVATASHLGMAYLVCMIVCSISFEVFTLKYTATFYGLIIAGLAAQVIRGQVDDSRSFHVRD